LRYIVLQEGKPDKWTEKEREIHKISVDEDLRIKEIRFPHSGKYDLILTVNNEFKTRLIENGDETELSIIKP
jgi:hypothetical protein